jgi:ABC-type branched-subunit amino acid transport system substrate-binding protein
VLPVFEKNNGLLFYPVQYEGEESSKNVIYTGAAPNQQAIPAVDYLMNDIGVKRWILEGTDYVYPRTTNRILEAYLIAKGVPKADISINYTPFGHADWQTRVAEIKRFGSTGRKTAVVSTINGDANVPFYKELGNQKISAEDIPVVAFSVWRGRAVGPRRTAARSVTSRRGTTSRASARRRTRHSSTCGRPTSRIPKRTTNDPMEAHYVGFNLWVKAVEKAKSTDVEAVLAALPGLETPNLTGGMARMLPNHHITKPVYIGEVRADGQFDVVWKTNGTVPGDAWSDYLAASKPDRGRLGEAEVRQLQHVDEGLLGPELQVIDAIGGQWLRWLLLRRRAGIRRLPDVTLGAQTPDETFLASLGELPRKATFADKEAIAERISDGPSAVRAVLTALLEDRLYSRTAENRIFIVKTTECDLTAYALVDPLWSGRRRGAAERCTKIGSNNRLRRSLRTRSARFGLSSPTPAVRLGAIQDMLRSLDEPTVALLGSASVETDAASSGDRHGPGDGRSRRNRSAVRLAAIETLSSRLGSDVRNSCAALVETIAGRHFVEPDAAVRAAAKGAVSASIASSDLFGGRDAVLRSQPGLGARADCDRPGDHVRGHGGHQHGPWRADDARGVHHVRRAGRNAPASGRVDPRRNSCGVRHRRRCRRADRTDHHPFSVRAPTRNAAGHIRPEPRTAAARAIDVLGAEPLGGDAVVDERNAAVQRSAWDHLQPPVHRSFTLIVFSLLLVVLKRTRLGLDIRAVSQNRAMARAMGVRSDRVDAMTFGLGAGIAGVAGVALSQLTNVGPNLGQAYIIDSFMVVVFGGVGNLWGTLIGGMSLGIVNKLLEPYSGAVLAKIFVLVALILFIQRRPRGLFPQTGRAAESQ